jgi:outer membrane biosynthesis protein TonB
MVQDNIKNTFFRILAALVIILGISFNTGQAQDFEEWKKNYLQEFQEFQNEHDKEFYEMLQQDWGDFASEVSSEFYEEPKPKQVPVVDEPDSKDPNPQKTQNKTDPNTQGEQPKSVQQSPEKDQPQKEHKKNISEPKKDNPIKNKTARETAVKSESFTPSQGITTDFDPNIKNANVRSKELRYFGIPISYKYYTAYEKQLEKPVNRKAIAEFWKHLSTKDYPSFLQQIQQVREQLSLNDFGYAQLLHNMGTQIYGAKTNEATLFTWFMLTQSGFGTKIAYKNHKVHLLVKASPHVFRKSLTMNGATYYDIQLGGDHPTLPERFYTYKGSHTKEEARPINLLFERFPTLQQKQEQRNLEFTFRDSTYSVSLPVDVQTVNYFRNYPQADLELYFGSQIENDETHSQLVKSLKPLITGKSTIEQVNLLLRFTQRSFEYQTDTEQFNTEKKMFPVETLYYPASDCDDRAIMLGYLLDQLTNLDYVVVRYPGHLTLAVHFPDEEPSGQRINNPITYNGKRYYVSDPTYFGADAGMIMPDYRNMQPSEVFDL